MVNRLARTVSDSADVADIEACSWLDTDNIEDIDGMVEVMLDIQDPRNGIMREGHASCGFQWGCWLGMSWISIGEVVDWLRM